jgi:menaquinone-dependent protoporphyrinogen oxidase
VTILVAAATKHGATMEIAQAIGQVLDDEGLAAAVEAVEQVASLDAFDAVVLGSAVYMGHWLEPARTFAERHSEELQARSTWLFSSGPIGDPPRPSAEDAVKLDDLMAMTGAREHCLFAGRVEKHRLGFAERALMLAIGAKEGDHRDWQAISEWAHGIACALRSQRGSVAHSSEQVVAFAGKPQPGRANPATGRGSAPMISPVGPARMEPTTKGAS